MTGPPDRIDLGDVHLRALLVADAELLARAVRESLDHLRPWMPWADNGSARADFQRDRLVGVEAAWARGEEYQYGLFDEGEDAVLGSFGLMTRRGRGTLEIGYWVHVDALGRGYATCATAALTDVALSLPRVTQVLVYTDEANERSARIPRRLGFELLRVEATLPSAPSETGRQHVWMRDRPLGAISWPAR